MTEHGRDHPRSAQESSLEGHPPDDDFRRFEINAAYQDRQLDLSYQYARETNELQLTNLREQRAHEDAMHKRNSRYGLAVVVALVVLVGYLAYIDKISIIQTFISLAAVGGGAFAWGKAKGRSESRDK